MRICTVVVAENDLYSPSAFDNELADCQSAGYIMSKFGELPSNNLGLFAVKTPNFCRDLPAI